MKLLISGIVILIIIIFCLIIFNSNIYFSEDFANPNPITNNTSSYNQNTIEDLINISYIPFDPYKKELISEYEVIDIYKKILDRSPTPNEIKENVFLSKTKLTEDLYNSFEYEKSLKVQNNIANNHIEGSIAKRNLINKLNDIYKKTFKKEIPERMVMPLRDCYLHMRSNYYLFLAMVEMKNFTEFENELLTTITLTKKNLLELFDKYFNLLELKLIAEDKIKIGSSLSNLSFSSVKDNLDKITNNCTISPTLTSHLANTVDLNELKTYLNRDKIKPLELKEAYTNKEDIKLKTRDLEKITEKKQEIIKDLPKDSEVYVRVYEPITYKQTYRGDSTYRPPICTSLGQKQLTSPVFTESKLLFQGTEIDKAFKDTQVGSIMPKFEYKEYQDIRIQ